MVSGIFVSVLVDFLGQGAHHLDGWWLSGFLEKHILSCYIMKSNFENPTLKSSRVSVYSPFSLLLINRFINGVTVFE